MSTFERFVKSLSLTAEFLIVVCGAFFLPIATSLWITFHEPAERLPPFTDTDLNGLIAEEGVVLLALGWFLRLRGFTVPGFGPLPSARDLLLTLGLAPFTALAWIGSWELLQQGAADAAEASAPAAHWVAILGASIINPLFEELVLCAYMIQTLARRRGAVLAVAASLTVRLSFHTYQGPAGMLAIGMIGLILTLFYARTLRLWPVLIVHGLIDFVGLANQ